MSIDIRIEQRLLEKIRRLPSERIVEVEKFIDLLDRHDEELDYNLVSEFTMLSEASFSKVWNNSEDSEYDKL